MQHVPMSQGLRARRGFTMIELLVSLVLLGLISAALYRVLVNNQRLYMAHTQRIELAQNIRAAGSILPAEFRELDAFDGDIIAMAPTRLELRVMRWLSFVCVPPLMGGALNGVQMVIRGGAPGQPMYFGSREPNVFLDTMLIYYDGDPTTRQDDFWARGTFNAIPNAPTTCPDPNPPGPQPAVRVNFTLNLLGLGLNAVNAIPVGAPVRGYEHVVYQLYQPGGDTSSYVGFQPANGTMQPLIGPVLANGLTFQYFDVNGNVTANRFNVARIDITVRARTTAAVRSGEAPRATVVDSVVTSVALRNNRRF